MNNDWEKQFKKKHRRPLTRDDALYCGTPFDDVEIDIRRDLRKSTSSIERGRIPIEFLLERDLDELYRIIDEGVENPDLKNCLKLPYQDMENGETPIHSDFRNRVFRHMLEDMVTVEEFYNETVEILKDLRITERAKKAAALVFLIFTLDQKCSTIQLQYYRHLKCGLNLCNSSNPADLTDDDRKLIGTELMMRNLLTRVFEVGRLYESFLYQDTLPVFSRKLNQAYDTGKGTKQIDDDKARVLIQRAIDRDLPYKEAVYKAAIEMDYQPSTFFRKFRKHTFEFPKK